MTGGQTEGVHVELYVRSLAPHGGLPQQRAVLDTLAHLRQRGIVEDYEVIVCGRQMPATAREVATEFGRFLIERIGVFAEWAEQNGWSLEETFKRRTIDSSITEQTTDVVTLPVMALAEYDSDHLRFVAPVTGEESQWTVQDRLDALRREGAPDSADRLSGARTPPPEKPSLSH